MKALINSTNGFGSHPTAQIRRSSWALNAYPRAIRPLNLDPLQRVLLSTDGTVTEVLEAYTGEPIRLVKLLQETLPLDHALPDLDLSDGSHVMHRKILLKGGISLTNYVFAETYLALDRLGERMRDALLLTRKPIGQLIRDTRLETFREILRCGIEPAGELAEHFHVHASDGVIFRVYRIMAGGQPLMQISEYFPEGN